MTSTDQRWYHTAVFYEVLIGAFHDANGDGIGDLRGLTGKLDYLRWLGVDCVLLSPVHASPMRDGGYDVSDFGAVRAEYGDHDDFTVLVDAAHRRGIRVVLDLVVNHTSDEHPWFQQSREDPFGPYGDFYVWRDTDTAYAEAPVIFRDTEASNWAYDRVRRQYYWHRFYSHQPDLNFENPAVQEAMLDVLRFWLDRGIDGCRLNAVPYLFEQEGTVCESLPSSHDFLRRARKTIDDEYPGRIVVAEANQRPADVAAYFGDVSVGGDECHLVVHPSLLPHLFLAMRGESRTPISATIARMPQPPAGGQWGLFLRNHDALTLETVTDAEREYLYNEFATEPTMRDHTGIRRRLAPLLESDCKQVALVTALLLSLPGSPVLYYGDEIGMGDNVWLEDRDGMRTPMQWTPGRNAGFSQGNPNRIRPWVVADPVYGYQAVNVEAQRDWPSSLLNLIRRLLHIRRAHPAFAIGQYAELVPSNPRVFAYTRTSGDDVVLCVNNLSRSPQPVHLDLAAFAGATPIELTGAVPFPRIGRAPYVLTLSAGTFYWFSVKQGA